MVSPEWLVNTSWLSLITNGLIDNVHVRGAGRIEQTGNKMKHGKVNCKNKGV